MNFCERSETKREKNEGVFSKLCICFRSIFHEGEFFFARLEAPHELFSKRFFAINEQGEPGFWRGSLGAARRGSQAAQAKNLNA